jgi:hypothetical protein
MALPAQTVALYCLKFGLNAAIHIIIFLGTSDSYKRHSHFYFIFSYCVRGKIKSCLIIAHYLHAKQHYMIFGDIKAMQD